MWGQGHVPSNVQGVRGDGVCVWGGGYPTAQHFSHVLPALTGKAQREGGGGGGGLWSPVVGWAIGWVAQ